MKKRTYISVMLACIFSTAFVISCSKIKLAPVIDTKEKFRGSWMSKGCSPFGRQVLESTFQDTLGRPHIDPKSYREIYIDTELSLAEATGNKVAGTFTINIYAPPSGVTGCTSEYHVLQLEFGILDLTVGQPVKNFSSTLHTDLFNERASVFQGSIQVGEVKVRVIHDFDLPVPPGGALPDKGGLRLARFLHADGECGLGIAEWVGALYDPSKTGSARGNPGYVVINGKTCGQLILARTFMVPNKDQVMPFLYASYEGKVYLGQWNRGSRPTDIFPINAYILER